MEFGESRKTLARLAGHTQAARLERIRQLSDQRYEIDEEGARELIKLVKAVFDEVMLAAGHDARQVRAITTKFRDAGRRSAPWRPTSSRMPGRPQDGADGNRINRWILPTDHKFYADEVTATLVEVRYYLQALSMNEAPALPPNTIQESFDWLLGQHIVPGSYLDPIQLISIDIREVLATPRLIQSGHLVPLDRDGRHEPENTFLMLTSSNQLQGSLTVDELLDMMKAILSRHGPREAARPTAELRDSLP